MSNQKDNIASNIGIRIKQLRTGKSLTQREFAKALETSAGYICDIEAGKSKPGFEIIYSIYRTYNVSLQWLIAGEGETEIDGKREESISIADKPKKEILEWINDFWEHGDQYERGWLIVEMRKKFPEFIEWLKKKEEKEILTKSKKHN